MKQQQKEGFSKVSLGRGWINLADRLEQGERKRKASNLYRPSYRRIQKKRHQLDPNRCVLESSLALLVKPKKHKEQSSIIEGKE